MLPDKHFWRRIIRKDVDEVFVALLILALPNLRKLEMLAPSKPDILAKALYHTSILRPVEGMGLQRLEYVSYGVRGNVTPGDIADIAPFFRLPSIQRICATGHMRSTIRPWPAMLGPSNVKHLEFHYGAIEPSLLDDILRSAQHLGSLSYCYLFDLSHRDSVLF